MSSTWASATPASSGRPHACDLEHGLALGAIVTLSGLGLGGAIVATWIEQGFGTLGEERLALLAATLVIVGIQIFFTSFLLSIMAMRDRQ